MPAWSDADDAELLRLHNIWGDDFANIAEHLPGRNRKSCGERWRNHVDPSLDLSP